MKYPFILLCSAMACGGSQVQSTKSTSDTSHIITANAADNDVNIVHFSGYGCKKEQQAHALAEALLKFAKDAHIMFRLGGSDGCSQVAANAAYEVYSQGGTEEFLRFHRALISEVPEDSDVSIEQIRTAAAATSVSADSIERAARERSHREKVQANDAYLRGIDTHYPLLVVGGAPFFQTPNSMDVQQALDFTRMARAVDSGSAEKNLTERSKQAFAQWIKIARRNEEATKDRNRQEQEPSRDETSQRIAIPTEGAPNKGNPQAPLTIVVFSDFQCPFCARLAPTLQRIADKYKDDVRIVWKHHPLGFHDWAKDASIAGEIIFSLKGDDAFWAFHDAVFAQQAMLKTPSEARAFFEAKAKELGISKKEYGKAWEDDTYREAVELDVGLLRQAGLETVGTPTSFLNGRAVMGALPFLSFEAEVIKELEAAKKETETESSD